MSKLIQVRRSRGGSRGDSIIIEEIQSPLVSIQSGDIMSIGKCQVVYLDVDGKISRARAHSLLTAKAAALASSQIEIGETGFIRIGGAFEATPSEWAAMIDEASPSGLQPGSIYYLSAVNAGNITSIAPSDPDLYVVPIGLAMTSTIMKIEIEYPMEN